MRARLTPPPLPGEGPASPPFSAPRGGGREGRAGEGKGGEGAEAEVGGASRPTPPPEQRVPAAAPCCSPRASTEASGGAASVGTRAGTFLELAGFLSENLQLLSRNRLGATWAQATRVGHTSPRLAISLVLKKKKNNGGSAGAKRCAVRTPETKVLLVGGIFFKGLPTAGTRLLPLKPFSPWCVHKGRSQES